MSSSGDAEYEQGSPEAVLVAQGTLGPLILDADKGPSNPAEPLDAFLDEIRLCLTLVAPCAIMPVKRWYEFEDRDFKNFSIWAGTSDSLNELQPRALKSFGSFNPEHASNLVRKYLSLDATSRGRIQLALDRFDRSMRRHTSGDAGVELAIALDSLLGDGEGELTWKVSLRSALLVAGGKRERKERRALIQAVYRLRSSVVHTGRAPPTIRKTGTGALTPDQLIPEATIATADVISTLILLGKIPDWFDAELGT
jgi:hypothetical protein